MCGFIQVKRTLGPPASLPCPRPTSSFTALPRLSRWRRRFVLDVTPDLDATVALGGRWLRFHVVERRQGLIPLHMVVRH